jgi:hypothetical protein
MPRGRPAGVVKKPRKKVSPKRASPKKAA